MSKYKYYMSQESIKDIISPSPRINENDVFIQVGSKRTRKGNY